MRPISFTLWAFMPLLIHAQQFCDPRENLACGLPGDSCAEVGCSADLICDKSSKTCVQKVPQGGKCDNAEQCQGLSYCSAMSRTCTPHKTQGTSCSTDEECYVSQCKDGMCKLLGGVSGGYCERNEDCKPGLVCNRFVGSAASGRTGIKTCSQDDGSKAGQDCNSDADCDTQGSGKKATKCQNGVCSFDFTCTAPGQFCLYSSQCCSKNCEFGFFPGSRVPLLKCT